MVPNLEASPHVPLPPAKGIFLPFLDFRSEPRLTIYLTFSSQQQVDKGAIRFVLSGANIMCPGLTHANAK